MKGKRILGYEDKIEKRLAILNSKYSNKIINISRLNAEVIAIMYSASPPSKSSLITFNIPDGLNAYTECYLKGAIHPRIRVYYGEIKKENNVKIKKFELIKV